MRPAEEIPRWRSARPPSPWRAPPFTVCPRRSPTTTNHRRRRRPAPTRPASPAPVEQADLPPFSNQSGRCPRCAGRGPIRVHFDRDCAQARGDHFHRRCPCGHEWVESCHEDRASGREHRRQCPERRHRPTSRSEGDRAEEWARPLDLAVTIMEGATSGTILRETTRPVLRVGDGPSVTARPEPRHRLRPPPQHSRSILASQTLNLAAVFRGQRTTSPVHARPLAARRPRRRG